MLAPSLAAADGAFPDSMSLFAYQDAPERLVLGTNFGLLVSEDGGEHFDWICETAIGSFVAMYQSGPTPEHAIFAITPEGVAVSRDIGCTWTIMAGTATVTVGDV